MNLILPEQYDPRLTIRETQEAIKYIRDTFQKEMGRQMNLERISAPLFVPQSSGLNDNLNGTERPVQFDIAGVPGETIEVVHSLAKWKRLALKEYGFQPGEGLYTNMNAIRRDEELDNLHSCYVDQWDWERVITKDERNLDTLKIVFLGLIAFMFGTAAGVLLGKVMCVLSGGKVNPLIGSAGVSAVPMAARVSQKVGAEADPTNFLLMHAMGPNVAGVIGTAVVAGTFMAIFGVM